MSFTILVIEDEKMLAKSIQKFLSGYGYETLTAEDGELGLKLVREMRPDLVFLDMRLPKIEGMELLKKIKELDPSIYVIIITAYGSIESAVEAMKLGAYDYIRKPVDLDELKLLADRVQEMVKLQQELSYYRDRASKRFGLRDIIGQCEKMQLVLKRIRQIAELDIAKGGEALTVLITGETGTGKELVARAIHYTSRRAQGPFIEVNCTAIPTNLLEVELFGYEKGAFTDAKTSKMGLFEAADQGTLFLDEIGDLDQSLQGKLLKAIEEKVVRRVGGLRDRQVDVRILAATNKDLDKALREGSFRRDLYYRLKVLTIDLPPLRERGEDILLLAQHFLRKFSARYNKSMKKLSERTLKVLTTYPWPGNVRELSHVLERAVLLVDSEEIQPEHLGLGSLSQVKNLTAQINLEEPVINFPPGGIILDQLERQIILQALKHTNWNRVQAARLLGLTRDTLRYRMEKFGITPPESGV
ncbi:MAG TPA: sigma-54 dependent transcriptional regulator [Candidatus Limnocylindrales bacterium]|nr:sigma-54 dependent transcriptional regulator [Candidatus Limnocylindrales bacterium]